MFYDAAVVDEFVGLADLGASTRPHATGRSPKKAGQDAQTIEKIQFELQNAQQAVQGAQEMLVQVSSLPAGAYGNRYKAYATQLLKTAQARVKALTAQLKSKGGSMSGLGSLGWSVQTPYGMLSPTKKVDLTNCQDLFARAQENFNLAAKHDSHKATYEKNMTLRYNQYQTCMTNKGQQPLALDTTADPTAIVGGSGMMVAPPPSALQYAAAVAGGVLTPPGTVPTPSAVQAQQAAASMTAQADGGSGAGLFSGSTLITLGLGVAALAALIILMKKSYPSGSAGTGVPGVKV